MGGEARKIRRVMKAALSNPLIAERILNQAEFKEKKKLRLINRFWRDSTLKEWRQSVPLKLHFGRDEMWYYVSFYFDLEERDVLMVKSFEAIMEGRAGANGKIFRIHDVPFRRLILGGLKLKSDYPRIPPEETFEQVVHFLAKFGSTLEYLKLEWVRVSQPFFESLLKGIIRRLCPKLKELVICDCMAWYPEEEDASTDYDSLLKAFSLSLQLFPEGETSKLTKLSIAVSEEVNDSVELLQFWEKVFSSLPNLKVLKYRPTKSMFLFGREYLITGASRLPLTKFPNGKYLDLEELDLHFDLREESSPGYGEFSALGTFLEVTQPPLKKLRITLHFNCNEVRGMKYANEMSNFHQFCSIHGHRLTELKINILKRCFCNEDDFQWISFLTGHYFPNLTHLTIVCFKREHGYDDEDGRRCIPGKINFDFEALKGMPGLQFFNCFEEMYRQGVVPQRKLTPAMITLAENGVMPWRQGQEINEVYENQLELKELREFLFHSSTDQFDEDSLKMVLGWMKNLKKLTLYLNKDTFPIVFETLPDLDNLSILWKSFDEETDAEFQFRTIWMDEVSRARQEKEWRNKQKRKKAKEDLGEVQVLKREAEKEKRERWRAWLERRRTEMERQEREWIRNQGKEEGEWNYVSYRKTKGESLPRLPPRQSLQNQSSPTPDDVFVIAEILKWKNKTNVFRTCYSSWDWHDYLQSERPYQIQYKSGED